MEGLKTKSDSVEIDHLTRFLSEHKRLKCKIVYFHNCRIAVLGGASLVADITSRLTVFLERIAMFRNAEIGPVYNKRGEGKCTFVAGEVNEFLSKDKSIAYSQTISSSHKSGIFQKVGYGHHVINFAITNDDLCLALDFTSRHDLDGGIENPDILVIVAHDEDALMSEVEGFYGMGKWS